jgi:hypothetical protein
MGAMLVVATAADSDAAWGGVNARDARRFGTGNGDGVSTSVFAPGEKCTVSSVAYRQINPLVAPVGASAFVRAGSAGFSMSVTAHGVVAGQPWVTVTRRCWPAGAENAGPGSGDEYALPLAVPDGVGDASDPFVVEMRALAHATRPATHSTTAAMPRRERCTRHLLSGIRRAATDRGFTVPRGTLSQLRR